MKSFAKAYERIGTENAFAVGPQIAAVIRDGYKVVKLNIGEPGANIAKAATSAAIASFKNHQTHYMPSGGTESLLTEISSYLKASRGIKYETNEIILSPGAKGVIAATMFILVNPGDEVIYPTPSYPIYESIADYVGAKGRPIEYKEEKGFRFDISDLKKLVNKKTKLLVLNSPSNPTGGVLEEEDYKEIAKLARQYDFYILADEIYSRLAYGKGVKTFSFKGNKLPITHSILEQPGMAERTVLMDGFSKTYAMTGLRIGFGASKINGFMPKFLTFAINFWACLPAPCMAAAEAALGADQSEAQEEVGQYEIKRDIAVEMFNNIEGIKCHKPNGAFYLFPNVTKVCEKLKLKDAESLRKYLLTFDEKGKRGVAVLARGHFGKRLAWEKNEYIRISFAGPKDDLIKGIEWIKEAIER